MSYISQVLEDGEELIHQAKVHWIVYLNSVVYALISGTSIWFGLKPDMQLVFLLAFAFGIAAVTSLVLAFLTRISTELAVTDRRIISKEGFIRRQTSEIDRSKVEGVNVKQSVLGRVLGYGTVGVTGTGGKISPMDNIDDPIAFRANVRPHYVAG